MKKNRKHPNGEAGSINHVGQSGSDSGPDSGSGPSTILAHPARPLPLMSSFDDAESLAQKENDPFYLAAFMTQLWLGGLTRNAAAEYAEKKNPKDRSLQTGQAWRDFVEIFPFTETKGFRYVLGCLFRFCASDNSPGNSLRRALVPLTIEHHSTGHFFGPKTIQSLHSQISGSQPSPLNPLGPSGSDSTLNSLARETIRRWCDWLDATIHLQTHTRWHTAPACFDPDPEKRQLAMLGNAQRHLARLTDRAKLCWLLDFTTAAEIFRNSPKWPTVGKAMSDDSDRHWPYAEVDTLVISLWPLVTRYNWTYQDLLNVLRSLAHQPPINDADPSGPGTLNSQPSTLNLLRYPCEPVSDFSTYCTNVLGLRKKGKGQTATNGRPPACDIARQLYPPQPSTGPKPSWVR